MMVFELESFHDFLPLYKNKNYYEEKKDLMFW